jgi:peptidyl-prolyl cis-trans isomerase B (cyclophilin B)
MAPLPPPPYAPRRTNTLAIVSLVTAFLCWPVGLVTGIMSLKQIKKSYEEGRGLAIGGIVVSSFALLCTLLVLAVFALGSIVTNKIDRTCTTIDPTTNTTVPCNG